MNRTPIRRPYQPRKKQAEHAINGFIRHAEVRITGDVVGESRVVSIGEAQRIADEHQLDLVEVSPNATPPVCRVCNYSKFLYDLKQKRREQKKNTVKSETKEMRLTYVTDEHDIDFKVRNAIGWLKGGDKVRCVIRFKGRTIVYKDQGEILLLRVSQMLEEFGKIEAFPKLDGKNMTMTIAPKKVHHQEKVINT